MTNKQKNVLKANRLSSLNKATTRMSRLWGVQMCRDIGFVSLRIKGQLDQFPVTFCFIPVSLVSVIDRSHFPPCCLWGSRLDLTLMYVLQSSGNGPHVHLNTAGPILHIPNFLFKRKNSITTRGYHRPHLLGFGGMEAGHIPILLIICWIHPNNQANFTGLHSLRHTPRGDGSWTIMRLETHWWSAFNTCCICSWTSCLCIQLNLF